MLNFFKKYNPHITGLLLFLDLLFFIYFESKISGFLGIFCVLLMFLIVICVWAQIIYYLIRCFNDKDINNKMFRCFMIYLFNVYYIPCFNLKYIVKDTKYKIKNIIYIIIMVILTCFSFYSIINRSLVLDSNYSSNANYVEFDSTDLKLAKTYYGDFLGDSLSVDLDKNGKYVNFNLLFVNEVYHSKPSFERSSEIFEQSAKYTFEQTDEFLSRFKLYYYGDNVTFVFDNDSVVDAIGIEDNVEYGYSDDKLLYVTISGISPEDMKKMEDKFKESGIDIIENKDFFTKVDSLANENDVDVLSSTLIGSRSWGYSDSNSDYDVRFVYKRELSDYIGIEEKNDTITPAIEDGYDIQGYDVRKFIKLIFSQNPIIYEILNSSDQNEEYDSFYYKIWGFSNEVFDKKKMIQKCQGIILNKISELKSSPKKPLKLYIYILRMIGIVNFIEDKGMFPTCTIDNVFSSESNLEYKDIIERLVDLKVHSKNVVIDDEAIKYLENALNKTKERMPNEDLGLSSKDIYEKSNKLIYDLLVTSTKKDELKVMFDDSSDVNVDGSVKKVI